MNSILYPLFAQVCLTFIVWMCLVFYRVNTLVQKRIHPQVVAIEEKAMEVYRSGINLSDNFENLFEIPVLFYAAILTLVHLHIDDSMALGLSWAFVVLRAGHSLVHSTLNNIRIRFVLYFASSICIWALWFKIIFSAI